ncbi:MAG: hypothetical protein ACKOW3_05870 [Hyphomicrobium sp.]
MVRHMHLIPALLLTFFLSSPALALKCVKDTQVVNGQLLHSPYCADEYLAQVARGYGIKVTSAQLRNNPNLKKSVCRTVFTDIRVSLICEAAGIPDYRR